MQNTQLYSECPLKVEQALGSNLNSSPRSTGNDFRGMKKPSLRASLSKENCSSVGPHQNIQHQSTIIEKDHAQVAHCLSSIEDPLWKHVCRDVIHMMGAESFFKIWNSTLGSVHSQDQSLDIHCHTEETAEFIQQYDFVILGSLQSYFPALKELKAGYISL